MKASDLKALLLLSFAPSSLSLNSFFSSEHSSSGLAERGARLRSIRKLPSLPPSLPVVVCVLPFSLSPYLCYGPLKCIRGPRFYCSCDHSRRRTTPQSTCRRCRRCRDARSPRSRLPTMMPRATEPPKRSGSKAHLKEARRGREADADISFHVVKEV